MNLNVAEGEVCNKGNYGVKIDFFCLFVCLFVYNEMK